MLFFIFFLLVLITNLTFAVSIYLDALKVGRIFVHPLVWFVTVFLFGVFGVIAYGTAKQTTSH